MADRYLWTHNAAFAHFNFVIKCNNFLQYFTVFCSILLIATPEEVVQIVSLRVVR